MVVAAGSVGEDDGRLRDSAKRDSQAWVVASQEPSSWLTKPTVMELFDWSMTYSLSSDEPWPSIGHTGDSFAVQNAQPLAFLERQHSSVAWFGKGCSRQGAAGQARVSTAKKLRLKMMERGLDLDSFGDCLHNKELDPSLSTGYGLYSYGLCSHGLTLASRQVMAYNITAYVVMA